MLETPIWEMVSPLLLAAVAVTLVAYGHIDAWARKRGLRFVGRRETFHRNGRLETTWCLAWIPVMRQVGSHSTTHLD
jgi:hypothetical protein